MNHRGLRIRVATAVTAALLSLILAGCGSAVGAGGGSGANSSSPQSITGTWKLVRGTDSNGAIDPGDAVVTLKIDGSKSGGQGPCNAFGATASGSTTGALTIRVGIHTMMACSEAVRNVIESRYFAGLGKIAQAAIANGDLTLSGGGVSLVFAKSST